MYDGQEKLDDVVWDKNDEDVDKALKQLRHIPFCRKVEQFVHGKVGKSAKIVPPLIGGGFNTLYRVRLDGDSSSDIMVRLPCPSLVQFPEEKILQEAATANLVAAKTCLPTPRLLFYGSESSVGPFILMDHVDHHQDMSARLTRPSEDPTATHTLDLTLGHSILENLWQQVSRYLLQMTQITFPKIGSLMEVQGRCEVAGRPITHNMTDMIRLANIPREVLPPQGTTFNTADEWYTALAEMHIAQLIFQHNDAITSADDCRNKYVARQIFRRLAKDGKLSKFGFATDNWSAQSSQIPSSTFAPAPDNTQSFRLWGDDFRAGNILLTKSDDIAAFVDWEFAYVGPTQFVLGPPWWLLLQTAEMWLPDIDDWVQRYDEYLKIWLAAMEKAETDDVEAISGSLPAPLSRYMRESWETGRFFLSYGARKSWVFDTMFWRFLDERFFGKRDGNVTKDDLWKTRVHLLSEEERAAMEPFVECKMKELDDRRIVNWDGNDARARLAEFLFD